MSTSRLIRFFSRRHIKTSPTQVKTVQQGLICTVAFLDGDQLHFEIDRKALAKTLYDKVVAYTKLVESDYFALQYIDTHNVKQWLDPNKSIKKQCKIGPPYTFRFRVKFYSSDPQNLHDELTRYLFVLQLKDDIRTGKLECPSDCAVELAALAMQAECGDLNSDEHSIDTLADYRFLPPDSQNEQFEEQVLQKWATNKGLTPADCEMQYLSKARWLEMYGVDLHTVMGKDGLDYRLGLTPTGILVFENNNKIGLFVWPKVTRVDFHRTKLTIVVMEDDDHDPKVQRDFVFLFRCHDEKECKHFWKCAMEFHIFYRTTSTTKLHPTSKSNFTRTASRFRFSGRTECQTVAVGTLSQQSNNFERKASHRFSRQASCAIRKKIQDQLLRREQEEERLKKLKLEQEQKKSTETKLSTSQKGLSLSAAQRLDHLILGTSSTDEMEMSVAPPPVPPRTTKNASNEPSSSIPNGAHRLTLTSGNCSIAPVVKSNSTDSSLPITKSSSNSTNNLKEKFFHRYPLFASPIPELTSSDHSRASYDNILDYCFNSPSNLNFSNGEEKFDERCANYDNLSYLIPEGFSSKRSTLKERKLVACKDYFAATTGFVSQLNGQGTNSSK